jgi:hypothetical protein
MIKKECCKEYKETLHDHIIDIGDVAMSISYILVPVIYIIIILAGIKYLLS